MKIFVAEDHAVMQETLTNIFFYIQRDIEIFYASSPEDAINQIFQFLKKGIKIDLIISDLQFQNGYKSFEVIEFCVSKELPILVFSMFENYPVVNLAIEKGAKGYISKNENVDEIINGFTTILEGDSYLSPRIAKEINFNKTDWCPFALVLTNSERNLLYCLASGMTMNQIAIKFKINENTLRTHRRNMMKKNNCSYEQLLACFNLFPPKIEFDPNFNKNTLKLNSS